MSDQRLLAEIADLKAEIGLLRISIEGMARHFREELTMRSLNGAILFLNLSLAKEERIPDFLWGTTTPKALRQAVRELGHLVGMNWPEQPMILAEREGDGLR